MDNTVKTGIYVRVSTEEQAREGFSIRAQQEKLTAYCKIKEWGIYKIYTDEGISGKNIKDRPAINELIEDIRANKVNNVLVFKVDRLTRNTRDLIDLLELFNSNNCAFNSLDESIDTQSASGRMFLKIIGIFAEFERENIIERTRLGNEKKAREGYSVCKDTPSYGYKRDIGNLVQEIFEEEAVIVREIFDMYLYQNKSCNKIASELNMRKIMTKKNCTWQAKGVKSILTNPNYVGRIRYSTDDESRYFEVEGKHEAIISEEIFTEVQERMIKTSKKTPTKHPSDEMYFTGTVYCALCGKKFSPRKKQKHKKDGSTYYIGYYQCLDKTVKACSAKAVGQKKLEEAFLKYIDDIEDLSVLGEVDVNEDINKSENALLISEYEVMIDGLEKKEKEIMSLYINNVMNFDEYTPMMKMVKNDKYKLQKELEELKSKEEQESTELRPEDVILSIRENWLNLTKKEKFQFLQNYVERIVILNKPNEGKIEGNLVIEKVDFYSN